MCSAKMVLEPEGRPHLQLCKHLMNKSGAEVAEESADINTTTYSTPEPLLLEAVTAFTPALEQSTRRVSAHQEGLQWFKVLIPLICLVGIVGNVLNLVVLTRRRMLSSMQRLERCATYGLTALAMSDMMLCVTILPHTFITYKPTVHHHFVFSLYYRLYGIALINLFMMFSNWLTVVIAINRFLVVMYPIRARHFLSSCKTLVSILCVVIASIAITLPYFMHLQVLPCAGRAGETLQELRSSLPSMSKQLRMYMRWIWPVLAVFLPLFILAFCNLCLIRELNNAALYRKNSCRRTRVKDTSHKVTLTLVIIVLMVILLVSPSEILKYINPYKSWGKIGHVVASVTNVLQATNFAVNFFLYCVVNPNFRRTISDLLLHCGMRQSSNGLDDSRSINGQQGETTVLCLDESCRKTSQQQVMTSSDSGMAMKDLHSPVTVL